MFATLLESGAVHVRNVRSTAMSIMLHGALVATVVALTVPRPRTIDAALVLPDLTYIPVAPAPPPRPAAPSAPAAPAPSERSLPVPILIDVRPISPATRAITLDGPTVPVDRLTIGNGSPFAQPPGVMALSDAESSSGAMDASSVERIPRIIGSAPQPRYPSSLRASGVTGRVVARFAVDTLGRAEMASLDVLEASHVLFAEAVRDALGRYRFSPGEIGGRKVRTMVQVPFTFAIR